jgi:hypothetical protein
MNKKDNEIKDLETSIREQDKRAETIRNVQKLLDEWRALSVEDQIKRRDSLIFDLAFLHPADRKLCIQHLSEGGIVNKREALENVNKNAKDLGIDADEEKSPVPIEYSRNLVLLTPAQDFIDNVAYITVSRNHFLDTKMIPINYVITSKREKFQLCSEELFKRGLYVDRDINPVARWSINSQEEYLNGDADVNISDIFDEIYKAFIHYIDFGNEKTAKLMACWVIGTYYHRQFKTYPYIHFNGDMEAGKTKTATLIACLSFNGELTFNSTPPYIISAIHNNHSTCCVDEAERLKDNKEQDSQTVISMYNAGYKKGNFCGKREQIGTEGKWVNKQFEAYSPKVFASIKGLQASLASRCISITMYKSGNRDIQNREIDISDPVFQKIRDKLHQLLFDRHILVKVKYDSITDEEIFGREWELSKPILTIAKAIDDSNNSKLNLYGEIRNNLLEIQKLKKEARIEETITPKLLLTLHEYLSSNSARDKFYTVSELINALIDSGEEAFSWLSDENKYHGRGRWLSNALRTAGVIEGKAIQKKIEGKNAKGFHIDLENIKKRLKNFEIEVESNEKI